MTLRVLKTPYYDSICDLRLYKSAFDQDTNLGFLEALQDLLPCFALYLYYTKLANLV
jgi:hypothetical protein